MNNFDCSYKVICNIATTINSNYNWTPLLM